MRALLDTPLLSRPRASARPASRLLAMLAATALVLGLTVAIAPAAAAVSAAPACTGNAIVCENALPGTPEAQWDIDGSGDDDIQGFATQISVNVGQPVQFKIDTTAHAYTIQIFRLGYYQGDGARKQADVTPSATLPQVQPACATDATTEIYDCGTWGVSATWNVPSTAVSGVYIALLTRTDNGDASHIPFIVRDDSSHSQVVFQTSDPTWEAYNTYGQSDFYQGLANGRAYKVSYNRPITTRGQNSGRDFLFANEYPMIRYMEQNGYDVSYISGLDSDVRGSLLTNHKVFVDAGHDEYWSGGQRANVEAARDAGVSLAFFSGNEVYWKTRWEPSEDGTSTANRTLVCYKDTWANAAIDPLGPTDTWRDPRFGGNGEGPENSLTGTMYMSNFTDLAITVSAAEGATRLWRNTPLASQAPGASTALLAHTIGYESDEDVDNGHRPAGLVDLSTTTGPTPQYLTDFGNTVVPGTTTHHVTMYKAPSGALVFGAGTIQWAWGVDSDHDGTQAPADERIRQATMNIFADMGATATTVASDLTAATKSTDTTPPVAVITSPTANSSSQQGSLVTVSGTATDTGGVVAGVEVSVDAGLTWHPAPISGSGTKSFTYTGVLTGTGAKAVQARATDDSGNIHTPVASLPLQVSCPCSMFGATTPATPAAADTAALTLGVKFTSSADGFITGIRFYKGVGNTGTHVGTLYGATGNSLAAVTFSGESATGWQTANFATAVPITAGTTYVAAYTDPNGHYSADSYYFVSTGHSVGTLTALGGSANPNNGVYITGTGFPTVSYQNTNYYVDAVYSATDITPLSAVSGAPLAGSSSVPTSTTATAIFSRSITQSTIDMTMADSNNVAVPGSITYDPSSRKVTFNPTQSLNPSTTYTVRLNATSPDVGPMAAPTTWSFTTAAAPAVPGVCPCSLFSDSSAPVIGPVADNPVNLGVAFTADKNGTITAIRFYKDPKNTGPHTVSLYTAAGALVGTATTTAETTSGWQTATFATPLAITKFTTYIASYFSSTGFFSYTDSGLTAAVDAAPLHTLANGGRYSYSGPPTSTYSANYFVDPVFSPGPDAPPTVSSVDPSDNSSSVPVSASVTATFADVVQASTVSISVKAADGTLVAGAVASESLGTAATFVPTADFSPSTHYTVTISGAKSAGGTAMTATVVSHFTTSGAAACPCSVFPSGAIPATSDSADAGAITVGLRFVPSITGSITGIRYFRSANNTGTHTGSLYAADGTKLTTLTFPNSTTTGWQMATFATPIVVSAGSTYVAAVYMPVGHYSVDANFFASPYVNAPLTGLAGIYTYGSDTLPTSSYNNGNYWVDAIFSSNAGTGPSLTVAAQTPAPGATGIAASAAPSASFTTAIDPSTLSMSMTGPGGTAVPGSSTYNPSTLTATFTPNAALPAATTYSMSVSATGAAGETMAAPATWSFSTVAPAAPTVSGLSPASGATGVSATVTPSVLFSTDIDPSTLQFTLSGPGGAAVAGVGSYDSASRTAKFTLTSALGSNTTYKASVTASSTGGTPMAAPATWSFTTVVATPPTVSGQAPTNGSIGVLTSTAVSATFSAPITSSTMSFKLTGPGSTKVAGTASYNAVTNIATFQPTAALAYATLYTASLSATGTNGGVMAAPVTWSFTTAAPPALTVSGQSPANAATGVPVSVSPTGTFSAPITTASLAFTLTGPGGAVAGTTSYNTSTRVATFKPTAALAYGTQYTASVQATASSGGLMAAPATWSFTTVAAAVPAVSAQSPADAATGVAVSVSPTGTFSTPITTASLAFTLTGPSGAVSGTATYNSTTRVATFKPTASLAYSTQYTASLQATGSTGGLMTAPATWSFTTVAAAVPAVSNQSPADAATGVAVATSPTGTFSVAITAASLAFTLTGPGGAVAGTTSYNTSTRVATFKPTSSLAYSTLYTASLQATGSTGGLMAAPASWAFTTVAAPAPTVSGQSPTSGSTTAASTSTVAGTFSTAVTPASIVFTVTPAGGSAIAGSTAYNATTRVATFTPTAKLTFATVYTVTLSGTTTLGGVMATPATWSFTTTPAVSLNSLWAATDTPQTVNGTDATPTTVGVQFTSTKAGSVTAIKFYAGSGNKGTTAHPVTLYSSAGAVLGSGSLATTVAGWNTVALTTPVTITAGTTYIAAYTAPTGLYSTSVSPDPTSYLSARSNGIMRAKASAGLSKAGTGFPNTASSTNFWVDPVLSVPNP